MTDSFESPAPNTSAWRPLALLAAYLCTASLGFLAFRAPLIVLASVVVGCGVLMFLANGRLRTAPLSGRESLVFFAGVILLISLMFIPGDRADLLKHLGGDGQRIGAGVQLGQFFHIHRRFPLRPQRPVFA